MDTQATSRYGVGQDAGSERPRYRCALYEEDVESGHIRMGLSSDSTCINHLRSPTDGYETLSLRPKFPPAWPAHLRYSAVEGKEEEKNAAFWKRFNKTFSTTIRATLYI